MNFTKLLSFLSHKSSLWFAVVVLSAIVLTASVTHPAFAAGGGYPDATVPCAHSPFATSGTGYWCKNYDWGYTHEDAQGNVPQSTTWSARGYGYRNCTDYVAWKIQEVTQGKVSIPKGWGKAKYWADNAINAGYDSDNNPRIGDIAVWTSGDFGHVAYVYDLVNGVPKLAEYNKHQDGNYTDNRVATADKYIHITNQVSNNGLAQYAGKIVQWYNSPNQQNTSWFVSPDLKRYWIKDTNTFNCLTNNGAVDVGPRSKEILDQLQDQTGQWATCGGHMLSAQRFMFRGSHLLSTDGRYRLDFQRSDGNIVLYGPNGYLWATFVASDRFVMQGDGNLVAYAWNGTAWRVTWQSGTNLKKGTTSLIEGHLKPHDLVMQTDGNLVLYAPGAIAIWGTMNGRIR